jgi:hypothetical protein
MKYLRNGGMAPLFLASTKYMGDMPHIPAALTQG